MLHFSKMHGLGNDFMVIDGVSQAFRVEDYDLAALADRKTGVGFDQLLLVEAPTQKGNAFKYRIFNSDGSEVSQCGNGARCFARFVREQELTDLDEFWVETNAGRMMLSIQGDGQVRVNMGIAGFEPAQIPLSVQTQQDQYELEYQQQCLHFSALEIGNPHALFEVESVADAPVEQLGSHLQNHPMFPDRINAGFIEYLSRDHIKLRVYERGVGETNACGSGACAAVIAGVRRGQLNERVTVELPGGKLQIEYAGNDQPVFLNGPATTVYRAQLNPIFKINTR